MIRQTCEHIHEMSGHHRATERAKVTIEELRPPRPLQEMAGNTQHPSIHVCHR